MARKTFISYKYSEAKALRDEIIKALGSDASFYNGETADSPDLTDTSTENIKSNLTDMMFNTSVTIVIISPEMKKSKWIDWEIEYCLKEIRRKEGQSKTNGVVGVIQKINGGYDWLVTLKTNKDGCRVRTYHTRYLYDIINKNRFNLIKKKYECESCQCINSLTGSYISLVDEEYFLKDPIKYIENAFDKSKNSFEFNLTKLR